MKRFLLAGVALTTLVGVAAAQVNVVPQVGVNSANVRAQTYSATLLSLVPAASATDIFCISGSATKTIHVRRIELSGTASTLVSTPIVLVHRSSKDTGTAATSTYVKTGGKLASTNGAATATVVGYNSTGGNPTIVDSSPTYIRTAALTLGISGTTAAPVDRLVWDFGTGIDAYDQGLDLIKGGTTQQYCINLNAVSVNAGVLQGYMEWTEE